jgi:hypothetical protein
VRLAGLSASDEEQVFASNIVELLEAVKPRL